MALVDKLAICEKNRYVLLEFIRTILPRTSNIPTTYYLLKKSIEVPQINKFILCKYCSAEIPIKKVGQTIKKCPTTQCVTNRKGLKSNKLIKIFNSDLQTQIEIILENYYDSILSYSGGILF